jgi:hypothetical protein
MMLRDEPELVTDRTGLSNQKLHVECKCVEHHSSFNSPSARRMPSSTIARSDS